jgi:predicted deacylase
MPERITINNQHIALGEEKEIQLNIARLPTYTNIDLPVHVFRGKEDGPVLLLTGGLHGDELNGIEIVRRMIFERKLVPKKGSVIAIPLVNVYGFIQNARGMPDGKDVNRSFPGIRGGSLARLVAYTLMNEILPQIDYGIDYHTGGDARANYPQIRCSFKIEENLKLAKWFAPPFIINSSFIEKSFRKAAHKEGKHIIVFETGESSRYDEFGIKEAIAGTQRLMYHLDMIDEAPEPAHETELYNRSSWIRAKHAGLFQPEISLGEKVNKKELLGHITDPYGKEWNRVISSKNGRIIGLNHAPIVHKGDALLHIAYE